MAVIAFTHARVTGGIYRVIWPAMGIADTGTVFAIASEMEASVQVEGTFGGATVALQGTLDGTLYQTLNDPQGNALTFTTASLEKVQESLVYSIRPSTSGGAGTSVNVTLLFRDRKVD